MYFTETEKGHGPLVAGAGLRGQRVQSSTPVIPKEVFLIFSTESDISVKDWRSF